MSPRGQHLFLANHWVNLEQPSEKKEQMGNVKLQLYDHISKRIKLTHSCYRVLRDHISRLSTGEDSKSTDIHIEFFILLNTSEMQSPSLVIRAPLDRLMFTPRTDEAAEAQTERLSRRL